MKINWQWIVPAIVLVCGCRETPPPVMPATQPVMLGAGGGGHGVGAAQHTGDHATTVTARRPGDDASRQNQPTSARPADPTQIVAQSARSTPPTTRAMPPKPQTPISASASPGVASNASTPSASQGASRSPHVPPTASQISLPDSALPAKPQPTMPISLLAGNATASASTPPGSSLHLNGSAPSIHRPAPPPQSVSVLDLLDAKGHATQQSVAVALPALSSGNSPTTRPASTLQVALPGEQTTLVDDPAATVVPLPANANEAHQREQAAERQQRAEADRQAAQTLNDSLMRVLLASPPKPSPGPATRPTIQLFDQ